MIEGYLQRRTIRNLYLIRQETISVLGMIFRSMSSFDLEAWLESSAPFLLPSFASSNSNGEYHMSHDGIGNVLSENYTLLLNRCIAEHEKACIAGDEEMEAYNQVMKSSLPTHGSTANATQDFEMTVEWDVENFILSGAVMHILCSLEELERGLIRILCLYGMQPARKEPMKQPIHPTVKDLTRNSPEWDVMENSKSLFSISGRHALLESYSINAEPEQDWNDRLWSMRTDRNTIARAVSTMRHPFQSFLQLHYDAFRAVRHLAREAMSAQGIVL